VQAGTPENESDYEKTTVEGIPFFIRKNLLGKNFEISWVGVWIIGQFVVKEV